MKKLFFSAVAGLGMMSGFSAFAQDWAVSCGNEPRATPINVSTVSNYNASVERFNAYNKAIRVYYACISKQAHARQLSISQKAKTDMEAVQKVNHEIITRINANLTKMQAEIVSGGKKLNGNSARK